VNQVSFGNIRNSFMVARITLRKVSNFHLYCVETRESPTINHGFVQKINFNVPFSKNVTSRQDPSLDSKYRCTYLRDAAQTKYYPLYRANSIVLARIRLRGNTFPL